MSEKVLGLSKKAYNYYIENVKGNKSTSYELAAKKLSRNLKMSKPVDQTFFQRLIRTQTFRYGNLFITVKSGTIVKILNHKGKTLPGWKKYASVYKKWNKRFEIHN